MFQAEMWREKVKKKWRWEYFDDSVPLTLLFFKDEGTRIKSNIENFPEFLPAPINARVNSCLKSLNNFHCLMDKISVPLWSGPHLSFQPCLPLLLLSMFILVYTLLTPQSFHPILSNSPFVFAISLVSHAFHILHCWETRYPFQSV